MRGSLFKRGVLPIIGATFVQKTREFIEIMPAPVRLQVGQQFDVTVCEDRHIAILNVL